jgi:hypothetical protein
MDERPHCAEPVIGPRFARTRWLHAGYELRAAATPSVPAEGASRRALVTA